jgi:hypothetical protein
MTEEGYVLYSDAERISRKNGAIADEFWRTDRKFAFKHKESKETVSILQNGSLLV